MKRSTFFHYRKFFWRIQIPIALLLAVKYPAVWDKLSVTYVAVLSIVALDETDDGNEDAAKARENTEN